MTATDLETSEKTANDESTRQNPKAATYMLQTNIFSIFQSSNIELSSFFRDSLGINPGSLFMVETCVADQSYTPFHPVLVAMPLPFP